VRGFVSGDEIAVAAALLDEQVYTFRSEDGMPLWAGNGRRDNQIVQPYGGGSGSMSEQPRAQSGRGRGQGFESEGGSFDRQGPGSEQLEGRGRGRQPDGANELPWWYQQQLDSESSQNPA